MVEPHEDRPKNKTITGKVVVWVVVAVLALVLILQNAKKTRVELYFWDVTVRLWVLLLGALLVGMALGWFLPKLRARRRDRDDND